jgi:hypothetical protein
LAITYASGCSSGCQYPTNYALTITATFGSAPADAPLISIDLPGTTNDLAATAMSGSGATRTYSYTTANVSTTSTATVTIQTLGGLGSTPTPTNSTFTITVAGGGGSPGASYSDTTAPTASNIVAIPIKDGATITWTTNEASLTWVKYGVSTSYGTEVKGTNYYTSHSATLTGLTAGTTYHYQINTKDGSSNGNMRADSDRTFTTLTTEAAKEEAAKETAKEKTVTPEATKEAEAKKEALVTPTQASKQDLTKEKDGLAFFIKTTKKLPKIANDWAFVHFIAYGTTNTANMTATERKDLTTDFKSIYNRVPASTSDWSNVDSMATGVKPATRVLKAEQTALKDFIKVYKRLPNFKVAGDDLGMSYIAYKLRAATKDLTAEKAAITVFKAIYKTTPTTSTQWAIVRAIAYSGAKR